jgi:ribosomal protein S18 acetylase RimI-like enzyme
MPSNDIEIRALGPADAAAFREIRLGGLRDSPEAFGSTYEEEVEHGLQIFAQRLDPSAAKAEQVVLGAFADGALVGVAACIREHRPKTRHKASVYGMYVAPEARGRGAGRALLARLVAEARAWPGVDRLTLSVVERAEAARALYRAAGFVAYGSEPDALRQDGVRDTLIYLTLDLAQTRAAHPPE